MLNTFITQSFIENNRIDPYLPLQRQTFEKEYRQSLIAVKLSNSTLRLISKKETLQAVDVLPTSKMVSATGG